MTSDTVILERTQELLDDPLINGKNIDSKVRYLLRDEYLRRLAQYHRANSLLTQKYGMSFEEFVSHRIAQEENFTWDVESDSMDWETAVSGAKTMERKLKTLQNEVDV